jgi:hypothetical protein
MQTCGVQACINVDVLHIRLLRDASARAMRAPRQWTNARSPNSANSPLIAKEAFARLVKVWPDDEIILQQLCSIRRIFSGNTRIGLKNGSPDDDMRSKSCSRLLSGRIALVEIVNRSCGNGINSARGQEDRSV